MKTKFKANKDIKVPIDIDCYEIELPIYHCSVKIVNKRNTKKLEEAWGNDCSYGMQTRNFLAECGDIMITVNKYEDYYIVHELHHATDMIMNYIQHEKDPESDEPSAYLIGYLYKEVMKIERYLK